MLMRNVLYHSPLAVLNMDILTRMAVRFAQEDYGWLIELSWA